MTGTLTPAFTELRARERVAAVLDAGTFREILDPFAGLESPHLAPQGIVPQSDDGAVVGRGTIDGVSAVVVALDGGFQGGGIGEVSGAKLAASLERAIDDNRRGIPTRAVILLETGGIRLQEANLGLLAIADIHAAIVELRSYGPVVGVVAGTVGCFGGMAIAAGLTRHLIVTRGGRVGLNGPEVIETEAGVAELDSSDRSLIWSMIGGEQRQAVRQAEILVADAVDELAAAVHGVFAAASDGTPQPVARAARIDEAERVLAAIDPTTRPTPADVRALTTGGSL
ncbi:biotin-independent malonate decarboxylase subunit beta [Clavibacter michiganensis]|uniref:Malonate decarboxylase subunit beta n=1 Tax=Clavibacter michiganensis subsp. insidiosus TaxID=33014 RepID=A0A0D5CK08_9MICO|nr:biotin-independent malonate decarboxylase subunit beta [Clavibacter michiganensis]AJW79610.1 malonate decarboxylase subunit beta [Clavibacter michiganensis subsp. insidiosus]AWF97619.1 biotin-independent malonate decarboxylase subunit beta [Clavibacter michiganensis subsp. insidiosus]